MHCGSTSMSSLISNISTSGRQPCRKQEREMNKVFLHYCKSFIESNFKCFKDSVGLSPKAAKLQFSGVIHHLLLMLKRKTAAGTLGLRLSFTGPGPSFSSPDTANSAGSEETATYAGKDLEARLCGGKPAMTVLFVNAKNVLNGSKSSQKA